MERSRHLAGTVLLSSLHVLTNSSFTNLAISSIIFMRHIYKNVLSAPFSLLSSYLFCFMGWPTLLSPFLFPSFFLFFYSRNSLYFCFSSFCLRSLSTFFISLSIYSFIYLCIYHFYFYIFTHFFSEIKSSSLIIFLILYLYLVCYINIIIKLV